MKSKEVSVRRFNLNIRNDNQILDHINLKGHLNLVYIYFHKQKFKETGKKMIRKLLWNYTLIS